MHPPIFYFSWFPKPQVTDNGTFNPLPELINLIRWGVLMLPIVSTTLPDNIFGFDSFPNQLFVAKNRQK